MSTPDFLNPPPRKGAPPPYPPDPGRPFTLTDCPLCAGRGRISADPRRQRDMRCPECHGAGKIRIYHQENA